LKSGNLNLLEPSGPVKACNGVALALLYLYLTVPLLLALVSASVDHHQANIYKKNLKNAGAYN
jgi:hypothetical protein